MLCYDEGKVREAQEKDLVWFSQLLFGFPILMIDGYSMLMLFRSGFGFYNFFYALMDNWLMNILWCHHWYMRWYDQIWKWKVGIGSRGTFSMLLIMHFWHYDCLRISYYLMMLILMMLIFSIFLYVAVMCCIWSNHGWYLYSTWAT